MRLNAALTIAAALTVGSVPGALAEGRYGHGTVHGPYHGHGHGHVGYVGSYAYGTGSYGYADAAIGGAYIGAPYTRFPSPSELVPPVLGYGSYGVPTVTGIRQAPTAQPTVYVIEGARRSVRPSPARARVLSRRQGGQWSDAAGETVASDAGGARVVSLTTR